MNTANEKFSMMSLDSTATVLPRPSGRLTVADLMHFAGKYRGLFLGEVDIPPTGAAPAPGATYIPVFRRRRR